MFFVNVLEDLRVVRKYLLVVRTISIISQIINTPGLRSLPVKSNFYLRNGMVRIPGQRYPYNA